MDKAKYDAVRIIVGSAEKCANLLRALGVEPPTKISPTTGKKVYAFAKTDEGFKELLDHEDPRVRVVVECRLQTKSTLEETRTERFINIAARGTLPIPLRYYAAHTGRWGGDDKINMQNLPRTSPLKKAILAPEGYTFIDCDSSQIECRTLAWLAGQDDLVDAFDRGEDVYKSMASAIYGVPIEEVTPEQRHVGKVVILGAGYGLGWRKFVVYAKQQGIEVSEAEAQRVISTYRETYPMIPTLWRQAGDALDAIANNQTAPLGRDGVLMVRGVDGIYLPNGLRIQYANLRWEQTSEGRQEMVYDQKKGRAVLKTRMYGPKNVENLCQALARIVIGEQMLMIARRLRVALTVHDSIGVVVPTQEAEEARDFVEACMRIRPKWAAALPLNCESKMGASYGG